MDRRRSASENQPRHAICPHMAQQRKPAFSARSPIWPRVPAQIAVLHFQTLLVIDMEVLDEAVHKLPFL